jgi:hypothetical protein
MNRLKSSLVTVALAIGVLAAMSGPSSARVVCNNDGDCWHTDRSYHYNSGIHVQLYPDSWYFHHDWDHDSNHHWRGHREGRGYWRNGIWVTF